MAEEEQDMTPEEVGMYADDKVDALIELLISKGVITEKEYADAYDNLFVEEDGEE